MADQNAQPQQIDFHQLQHVVEDQVRTVLGSPANTNSVIGAVMKHIGYTLVNSSGAYESLTPESILVKPELLEDGSNDAIILMTSIISGKNTYQLLVNCKAIEGQEGSFDTTVTMFVPDCVVTTNTQFFELSPAARKEVLRQLSHLCKKEGSSFFGLVYLKNYFPSVAVPEEKDQEVALPEAVMV